MPATTKPTTGRRAVLKGSAWAVPVIATAAAAPALAASPGDGPCLKATYTINSKTSSSATGSWRFELLCPASKGEVIALVISPPTDALRLFQMQATGGVDFLRVPPNSSGSTNGTTKALEIIRDAAAGEVAFANFNFSGYFTQKPTITVTFRGQVVAVYTHT